jgi:hypothetical protein
MESYSQEYAFGQASTYLGTFEMLADGSNFWTLYFDA